MNNTDDYETMKSKCTQFNFDTDVTIDNEFQLNVARKDNTDVSVTGTRQEFLLKLVSNDDKKTDKWYREHTKVCVDFVITGLDPYWLSDDK